MGQPFSFPMLPLGEETTLQALTGSSWLGFKLPSHPLVNTVTAQAAYYGCQQHLPSCAAGCRDILQH